MNCAPSRLADAMRTMGVATVLALTVSACSSGTPLPGNTPVGPTSLAPTSTSPTGAPSSSSAGSLIAQWSETQLDRAVLEGIVARDKIVLIDTPDKKQRLLATVPTEGDKAVDPSAIEKADLGANVLVLGSYPNCQASSRIAVSGSTIEFVRIPTPKRVACAWAPYTIDVWEVPRSALGPAPYSAVGATAR